MDTHRIGSILEVQQLLTAYASFVDARDWERYRSIFTEDAVIDYRSSPFGFSGTVDEVVEWLDNSLQLLPMTMHYVMNIDTEFHDDSATVRAQFYNPMQIPGFDELSTCGGYYHHNLVQTPDGWRSTGMREEILWFTNSPAPRSP